MSQSQDSLGKNARIIFLHHSTGNNVWKGGVADWIGAYNEENGPAYSIVEQAFPKQKPYGWANYPYDYWNIWVKNAGDEPFMEEPTLEMLTREYDVIIFKHCYPVADVQEDAGSGDIASDRKAIENYRLQYEALKEKMREFPEKRFIVWTGALRAEDDSKPGCGERAKAFFDWVRDEWDEPGDNIFVWDFATIESNGGLYLKKQYQNEPEDSHPAPEFCKKAAPLFGQRIVDVIEGRGDSAPVTGGAS